MAWPGWSSTSRSQLRRRASLVSEPRNTTMVWISDFYEFQNDQPLFEMIKEVKESGVRFLPVGALKNGYFSVNEWFRDKLKGIGLPVLTGSIDKLIGQLRDLLCPGSVRGATSMKSKQSDRHEAGQGGAGGNGGAADAVVLRQPAEVKYAEELAWLASMGTYPRPFTWKLSPR